MQIDADNWPMRRFAHRVGARFDLHDGEIIGELALERPSRVPPPEDSALCFGDFWLEAGVGQDHGDLLGEPRVAPLGSEVSHAARLG
jgi:hypothetical protein